LSELVLTAYDIRAYLHEALPALRAAIYRGNLAQAKDVLALHDEFLYDEYDLSEVLSEGDHSWVFTEKAADPESMDPQGDLVGLAYPLILLYHRPDVFRMVLGGSEIAVSKLAESLPGLPGSVGLIESGYREGLRAMWEIVGYLSAESTAALQQMCLKNVQETPDRASRFMERLAQGLAPVVQQGYGLVIERD
jgi:hypothetical protein